MIYNKNMKIGKKNQVITELFRVCRRKNNYIFHNDLVKNICKKVGFGNPFDVTKLDNIKKFTEILIKNNYAILHKGQGKHQFIKGIDKVFHKFEPIQKKIDWKYKKSLLNQYNSSESNILSVANNQRILHHFIFNQDREFEDIEIEIDLTIEFQGIIGIFEGKNGRPENFSIYQLYHPFLYYFNANRKTELKGKIKNIFCVYVLREKSKGGDLLKLWKNSKTKYSMMM